ncbi:hypothetical protein PFMALIP_00581 [Plasmodium falciparum MaliPS096_E11]|uniref:Uncharacterized protein n=1 Tax=Plasmodium falciparum MaliPS096_E11 TaxID=1036727 RepID=A0A024WWY1_PLAFA|nr:hypothetical protein PFMALIP_00581 [Plasmodium falciparum MaliPS096_E11]
MSYKTNCTNSNANTNTLNSSSNYNKIDDNIILDEEWKKKILEPLKDLRYKTEDDMRNHHLYKRKVYL